MPLSMICPHRLSPWLLIGRYVGSRRPNSGRRGRVSGDLCGKKLRSEGLNFSPVGLDLRVPKPGAQLVKGREVVLDLSERRRPPAPWQVLEQLGRPGVGLARTAS